MIMEKQHVRDSGVPITSGPHRPRAQSQYVTTIHYKSRLGAESPAQNEIKSVQCERLPSNQAQNTRQNPETIEMTSRQSSHDDRVKSRRDKAGIYPNLFSVSPESYRCVQEPIQTLSIDMHHRRHHPKLPRGPYEAMRQLRMPRQCELSKIVHSIVACGVSGRGACLTRPRGQGHTSYRKAVELKDTFGAWLRFARTSKCAEDGNISRKKGHFISIDLPSNGGLQSMKAGASNCNLYTAACLDFVFGRRYFRDAIEFIPGMLPDPLQFLTPLVIVPIKDFLSVLAIHVREEADRTRTSVTAVISHIVYNSPSRREGGGGRASMSLDDKRCRQGASSVFVSTACWLDIGTLRDGEIGGGTRAPSGRDVCGGPITTGGKVYWPISIGSRMTVGATWAHSTGLEAEEMERGYYFI
ncbi:hypothetical protein AG1IA_04265 [Rhizoctonia solani AG-1 IA]|uniref:Uncharacterized protein n=1 Tax=Thanatephorus cucumeris (strain AG1-IA) TaxID=983506 RepID=L8WY54_THACA|nr:hypothetical protein AG1IA_04265 [Rhizoctonia solani AG-1 IA]